MDKSWGKMNHIKLGKVAELYAKTEFLKRGFQVYSTEADDSGIDFVAIDSCDKVYKIQVKACRNNSYQYIKEKFFYKTGNFYIFYIRFVDDEDPDMYMISTNAWEKNLSAFVYHPYDNGQESDSEYGIQYSKKNCTEFEEYKIDKAFVNLLSNGN